MNRILHDIVAEKEKEVRRLKDNGLAALPKRSFSPGRDFKKAIGQGHGINLIAEIKFASPSEGMICPPLDPLAVGRAYEQAGARIFTPLALSLRRALDASRLKRLGPLFEAYRPS